MYYGFQFSEINRSSKNERTSFSNNISEYRKKKKAEAR
jgi:predicted CopG family antitoxin